MLNEKIGGPNFQGFNYIPVTGEHWQLMPEDLPSLLADEPEEPRPFSGRNINQQPGDFPKVIINETDVVLRPNLGWCMVPGDKMYPIERLKRGPFCKSSEASSKGLHSLR